MGALALDEIVDPDAVDRCEWHGVSCPLSRTTTAAAQGRTPSSGEAAKIIACLCTATLPACSAIPPSSTGWSCSSKTCIEGFADERRRHDPRQRALGKGGSRHRRRKEHRPGDLALARGGRCHRDGERQNPARGSPENG